MTKSPIKTYSQKQVNSLLKAQRNKSATAVMDLFYALKEIKGTPTLKDLVKLAKRIK
jgi:hypothetical protein